MTKIGDGIGVTNGTVPDDFCSFCGDHLVIVFQNDIQVDLVMTVQSFSIQWFGGGSCDDARSLAAVDAYRPADQKNVGW